MNDNKAFLYPVEGRTVLDLTTGQPIPAEGSFVEMNGYYRRRVADGDAEIRNPDPSPDTADNKKTKSK